MKLAVIELGVFSEGLSCATKLTGFGNENNLDKTVRELLKLAENSAAAFKEMTGMETVEGYSVKVIMTDSGEPPVEEEDEGQEKLSLEDVYSSWNDGSDPDE